MFVVKLTDFIPEKNGQQVISLELMPRCWVKNIQTQLDEVRMVSFCPSPLIYFCKKAQYYLLFLNVE